MPISRQLWVILHRWAGLTIAVFLTVAGVTGSILAFGEELEPLVAPKVFKAAPPSPGAALRDPFDLRDQVLARYPDAVITHVPMQAQAGRSLTLDMRGLDPKTGELGPYRGQWDEIFLNPYDGSELGHRTWGHIRQGRVNLFPFIHRLHDTFALGDLGNLAFGVAGMIWTLDCFIGFYLTLPIRLRRRTQAKAWTARWASSWLVRWKATPFKLTFDLHRAGGLWLWPALLVFAWSGVAFNLPQAYDPVMGLVGYQPVAAGLSPPQTGSGGPGTDLRAAASLGASLAQQVSRSANVTIDETGPASITFYPRPGVYLYRFTGQASVASVSYGDSMVLFSARTGALMKTILPQRDRPGMAINAWLEALHYAAVGGLPYKMAVSALGLLVTGLSVTGVLIWMKKRRARQWRSTRAVLL